MNRQKQGKGSWKNLVMIALMLVLAAAAAGSASAAGTSTEIRFIIFSDPAISLNAPQNGSTFGVSYVLFNYSVTDFDGHTSNCTIYSDSSLNPATAVNNQLVPNGSSAAYNHTGLSNGTYYWKVNCTDTGGNSNESAVWKYSIDLEPPGVNESNTQPQPGAQYNQTQTVQLLIDASENSTVTANVSYDSTSETVNLTYNGTQWYYNATFNSTLWTGQYNITFNVSDIYGNSNITSTNFTINDITPPNVADVAPAAGTGYAVGTSVNITANVTDPYYDNLDTVLANVTWGSSYETLVMTDPDADGIYNATFTNTTGLYDFNVTIIANDTSSNINNTETTNFSTSDAVSPLLENVSLSPRVVIRGRNISVSAQAADNVAVDGIYANITLPNGTVRLVSVPAVYTTEVNGTNNITIFANDTSGNINYTTDSFIVADPINITITVFDSNISAITVNLTIYLNGTTYVIDTEQIIGNTTTEQASYTYDLLFDTYDSNLTLLLRGVELPLNDNETLGVESVQPPVSGYIATYGINTTFNFTSARVRISYAGLNYSNEDNLRLDICHNWDFLNNTCLGTWTEATDAVQDTGSDTFTVNATSFSAFSIRETAPAVPAGGGHGGGGGAAPAPEAPEVECSEDWVCTGWSECAADGITTRMCADWNACGTEERMPSTEMGCDFRPPAPKVEAPEKPKIEVMPPSVKAKEIITSLLFVIIILGALFVLIASWQRLMYPPETKPIEFIELEAVLPVEEKGIIRKFEVEHVKDFKEIIHFARHGPAVILIDIKKMVQHLEDLKKGVRLLKKTLKATDGDIAGLRDKWIVATSFGIKIHRGNFVKTFKIGPKHHAGHHPRHDHGSSRKHEHHHKPHHHSGSKSNKEKENGKGKR